MDGNVDRCCLIAALTGKANAMKHHVSTLDGITAQPVFHPVSPIERRKRENVRA